MFTAHSTFSSCRCLLVVNLYSGEQTTTYNSFTAERPCSVFFFGAASNLVTRLVITPTKKNLIPEVCPIWRLSAGQTKINNELLSYANIRTKAYRSSSIRIVDIYS